MVWFTSLLSRLLLTLLMVLVSITILPFELLSIMCKRLSTSLEISTTFGDLGEELELMEERELERLKSRLELESRIEMKFDGTRPYLPLKYAFHQLEFVFLSRILISFPFSKVNMRESFGS